MSDGIDATAFGTTCVRVRTRDDLNMILQRMEDGEGLKLMRDLTFDYEFLEEGRSLSLVDDKGVNTKSDMKALVESHQELEDGTFKPHIKFAFFELSAVEKTCKELAKTLKDKDDQKQAAEELEEDRLEDLKDIGSEKLSYKVKSREWSVPETTGTDARAGDARYATGGAPQQMSVVEASSEPHPTKKITKYMTDVADENHKTQKVYIEEGAVVNSDKGSIRVDFKQTSYSVCVNASSATYVLGPIECGHIVPSECKWRLSAGKRLTITLARSKMPDMASIAPKDDGMPSWQIYGALFTFVLALVLLLAFGKVGK